MTSYRHPVLPELLAPAGSPEALEAALLAGADAVYLGGSRFNARMNAHNFDTAQLREAVTHAHRLGGRVYLTLKDGTVIESTACSYTLRSLVEQVAANASAFTEAQLSALRNMLARFESTTSKWNIEGIV